MPISNEEYRQLIFAYFSSIHTDNQLVVYFTLRTLREIEAGELTYKMFLSSALKSSSLNDNLRRHLIDVCSLQ